MKIPAHPPFEDYAVYKGQRDNGRFYVTLVHKITKKHRLMSYARYRLSVKLGRELLSGEEADHRNGNRSDDTLKNLQVLPKLSNLRKAIIETGRSAKFTELSCPECGVAFVRESRTVKSRQKNGCQLFCSRLCSGRNSTRKRKWRPIKAGVV